jgi:hypothetical protein
MFDIDYSKIITISRGDAFEASLFINCGTNMVPQRYLLQPGDIVYFALMEPNQKFEDAILKKVYTVNDPETPDGDLIISLKSEDTQHLLSGKYFYTIKVNFADSTLPIQTVIEKKEFWILD